MPASKRSTSVVGLGGIFFRAKDLKVMSKWYSEHLGMRIEDNVAVFEWRSAAAPRRKGHTVWALFPSQSTYFDRKKQFMVNYRVTDLARTLKRLRKEGVRVAKKMEESEYGKFGWVYDPEGNKIELWEPPGNYRAPEKETPME